MSPDLPTSASRLPCCAHRTATAVSNSPASSRRLWSRITAPTLLLYGKESWSGDPGADGRAALFNHARVAGFEGAGHWLHHDRLDEFLRVLREFFQEPASPAPKERIP